MPEIAICVATYQRPEGLQRLLASLRAQSGLDGRYVIVVVDNDPHGSAQSLLGEKRGNERETVYAIEPDPGIPAARNHGVRLARELGAQAVAFIDDDEAAAPGWLYALYTRLQTAGADAVTGPVLPLFPPDAPTWAGPSGVYERPSFPAGTSLSYASTANAMLRLDSIADLECPFDRRFQYTGGSDSYLFHSLYSRGASILWEPEALVYEHVPHSRISLSWIAARSYRHGITLTRCDRLIHGNGRRLLSRAARGVANIPLGILECAGGLLIRSPRWRQGIVRMCRGAGALVGLLGVRYQEYRR